MASHMDFVPDGDPTNLPDKAAVKRSIMESLGKANSQLDGFYYIGIHSRTPTADNPCNFYAVCYTSIPKGLPLEALRECVNYPIDQFKEEREE